MVLRVKLEIVPFGNEDKAYEIGRLDIFNKSPADHDEYEYGVIFIDKENNIGGLVDKPIYHNRGHGAWMLVYRVLDHLTQLAGNKRNNE